MLLFTPLMVDQKDLFYRDSVQEFNVHVCDVADKSHEQSRGVQERLQLNQEEVHESHLNCLKLLSLR